MWMDGLGLGHKVTIRWGVCVERYQITWHCINMINYWQMVRMFKMLGWQHLDLKLFREQVLDMDAFFVPYYIGHP